MPLPRATLPTQPVAGRRKAVTKRACVAVLTGLVAFAALQIATAVALERRFPGMIDPSYGLRLACVRRAEAAPPRRALAVVMLGSSRTHHGLASDVLQESLSRRWGRPVAVVNAGLPACGPLTELLLWRRLRRDGARPDLLLVEVLPGLVTEARTVYEGSGERMPADHLRGSDLSLLERYETGARPRLRRDVLLAQTSALYAHRLGILHALMPCLLSDHGAALVTPPGPVFLPNDPPPEQRARALNLARREYASTLRRIDPDGSAGRALRELLASCRRTRIPVALVLMPEGPTFRSWYAAGTLPKFRQWLKQLCRANGAGFVDAEEWIDEDDFLDSHHLLRRGAEKFTERLGREALPPLLRR